MCLKYNLEKLRLYFLLHVSSGKKRTHYQKKYDLFLEKDAERKPIHNAIRKIKKKSKKGKKIIVYFLAYEKTQWAFDTIFEEFRKDALFDPKVFVSDAFERKGVEENPTKNLIDFFKNKNYDVVTEIDLKKLPDIIVTPRHDIKNIGLNFELSEIYDKILLVYCPYLWVVERCSYDYYYTHDDLRFFWKKYYPNKLFPKDGTFLKPEQNLIDNSQKKEQKLKKFIDGLFVTPAGSPKTDLIIRAAKRSSFWKQKDTKKIIYAPHWSLYDSNLAFGTFMKYYERMYEYVKKNPDIEMVIKPHPILKRFIADKELQAVWGTTDLRISIDEYNDFLKKWKELPNGNVMDDYDYFSLFKSSDAMILDSMSFLLEYGFLLKPMCFLSREKNIDGLRSKFNFVANKMLDTVSVAYEWDNVVNFIEHVVKKEDYPQKRQREEVVKKYFSINAGHVGKFIKRDIKKGVLF